MIWTNGRIVPDHELRVGIADRIFEHGLGLFETLRTWNGRPVLLDRHLARLQRSAKDLGVPLDPASLPGAESVAALLRADQIEGDALLRITLTGGITEARGSTLWMRSAALPPPIRKEGAVVVLGPWEVAPSDALARHKTLNYWARRLAFEQARELGFDEVLSMTWAAGGPACCWEGSRTNLFIVKNDELITPTLEGPIVPGVMRGLVLEHARDLLLKVRGGNTPVRRSTLREADEVFLTNSVRGIIPVARASSQDSQTVHSWMNWPAPGPWMQRLWIKVSDWLLRGGTSP